MTSTQNTIDIADLDDIRYIHTLAASVEGMKFIQVIFTIHEYPDISYEVYSMKNGDQVFHKFKLLSEAIEIYNLI